MARPLPVVAAAGDECMSGVPTAVWLGVVEKLVSGNGMGNAEWGFATTGVRPCLSCSDGLVANFELYKGIQSNPILSFLPLQSHTETHPC